MSTRLFFTFMGELKTMVDKAKITPTHDFISGLDKEGKLLRCYTQNIDCLEQRLGMNHDMSDKKNSKVIQLHGDLSTVLCIKCRIIMPWSDEFGEVFKNGEAPTCPKCVSSEEKRSIAGMRSRGIGILRPNIVLYNEPHTKGLFSHE